MELAFKNVRGKKERGPGINVNLNSLYAEAKAATAITAVAWRNLATSVESTGEAYVSEQQIMNHESNDNDGQKESNSNEDHNNVEGGYNLPRRFYEYKSTSKASSQSRGFYVDGSCKKFCKSLPDVLFIKENEYSEEQISRFGLANLDNLRNAMVNKYMDCNARFDTDLYNQISAILRVRLGELLVSVHLFLTLPTILLDQKGSKC
ncbi:hypothetical protein BJV82DRAFT_518810 [Fennellomyces sp. T-0311]|nr:hypothetical protein BJV82DRAFT_518810 [Fennellomyces sp. T-0311]